MGQEVYIHSSNVVPKYRLQDSTLVRILINFKGHSVVKDHVYRMVIVEGRCTMARLSSLGANSSLVDTKV